MLRSMTTEPPRCPQWPPPDDELIGTERARLYIAWIREHAGPVLAQAEAMIEARYPGSQTHRSAVNVNQLAIWSLSPKMSGLSIGTVWCAYMAGSFAMVDISITRDGELIARPGLNMRDR